MTGPPRWSIGLAILVGSLFSVGSAQPSEWSSANSSLHGSDQRSSLAPAGPALVGSGTAFGTGDPSGDSLDPDREIGFVAAYNDGTSLVFTVLFFGPVVPAGFGANDIYGFIEIDTDRDSATGNASLSVGEDLGWELAVALATWDPIAELMDVIDSTSTVITRAPVQRFNNGFDVMIDLEAIGVAAGQSVHVAVAVGDEVGPTDFAPNDSVLVSSDDVTYLANANRFEVSVSFRDFTDRSDTGRLVAARSADSALFYFFDADNWEVMVKVLDGCAINQHYWVFAAATTNVEYELTVVDRVTGEDQSYFNPLGTRSPAITDTQAFATCP